MMLAEAEPGEIFVASLVLIGLLVLGFLVVSRAKGWLDAKDVSSSGGLGFTLSDLRQLHKSGQMSDDEFERARLIMTEASRRALERDEKARQAALQSRRSNGS